MKRSIVTIIPLLLLFCGCEETVYTQFCNDKKIHVNCLKIESQESRVDTLLYKAFSDINISDACPFTLQGIYHKVDACTNPVTNAVGADFDGYVKLQVFHNGTCYYRVQQDFKSSPWQESMNAIAIRLQKDLNL